MCLTSDAPTLLVVAVDTRHVFREDVQKMCLAVDAPTLSSVSC